MNNQLSKKNSVNHDPSEISDSESVLSNEEKMLSKAQRAAKHPDYHYSGLSQSNVLLISNHLSDVPSEILNGESIPTLGTGSKESGGIFGFSMSHFFSQVKKSLWENST